MGNRKVTLEELINEVLSKKTEFLGDKEEVDRIIKKAMTDIVKTGASAALKGGDFTHGGKQGYWSVLLVFESDLKQPDIIPALHEHQKLLDEIIDKATKYAIGR